MSTEDTERAPQPEKVVLYDRMNYRNDVPMLLVSTMGDQRQMVASLHLPMVQKQGANG